jgi:hypothetical protein
MTATTTERLTKDYGDLPHVGTLPQAANTLILKGTLVSRDSSGRANPYAETTDGSASLPIQGVAQETFDNRTTAPEGGGAGAINCELEYGVREFLYTGSTPVPGSTMFAVDNQTVNLSSTTTAGGGTRGIAGYAVAVNTTNTTVRLLVGPHITGQIVIAASEAAQLDQAQLDIDALELELGDYTGGGGAEADVATGLVQAETDVAALQVDAESAACEVVVPLGSLRLSTGAAVAAFADNTTDGFQLTGSEALGIRWNDSGSSRITVAGSFEMPADADDTAAVTLHFKGFRDGAADAAMVLTVTLFAQEIGDAYTADTNAGGSSTAFNGATTVITDETLAVLAGVLPAGATVNFTAVPDAALDGDDFVLTGVKAVYTRALRAS